MQRGKKCLREVRGSRSGADFCFAASKSHQFTLQDHAYGADVPCGVHLTSTYCAYPRRDGQAELTWLDG